jgi:hypothetical protein
MLFGYSISFLFTFMTVYLILFLMCKNMNISTLYNDPNNGIISYNYISILVKSHDHKSLLFVLCSAGRFGKSVKEASSLFEAISITIHSCLL